MRNAITNHNVRPATLSVKDFFLLFQSSPNAILLEDMEGNILEANSLACSLHGIEREELVGTSIFDLYPETEREVIRRDFEATLQVDALTVERHTYHQSGKKIPILLHSQRLRLSNQQEVLLVSVSDITELKKKHNQLQKLQTLCSHSSDAVFLIEPKTGNITEYNQVAEFYFAQPKQKVIGKRLSTLFPFLPKWDYLLGQLLAHNSYYCQNVHFTSDNTRRVLDIEFRYMADEEEEGKYVVAMVRDLTLLKETELKLQAKNQELDTFIYRASHDLKGPLDSIRAVLNYVQTDDDADVSQRYFRMIEDCTDRLHTGILNLVKTTFIAEWNGLMEEVSLASVLEDAKARLRFSPVKEKVNVTVHPEYLSHNIFTSPELLSIVFQQVIDNSLQFKDKNKPTAEVEIAMTTTEEELYVRISDNGIGICEKIQPKVFDMFYRGSVKSKGSGLGLYIVKKAIEKLQGRYALTSAENIGTTFELWLPLNY
ncbi:MAG: PAS domain S-box protein [Bacteroidia bacterium]